MECAFNPASRHRLANEGPAIPVSAPSWFNSARGGLHRFVEHASGPRSKDSCCFLEERTMVFEGGSKRWGAWETGVRQPEPVSEL